MEVQKKSHKEWRKSAKKQQRKKRRQLKAMKRDEALKQNENSPTYQVKLAEERALELVQLQKIELMNDIEHEKWFKSELRIEKQWKIQKQKLEEQAKKKEEERLRIQAEFEAEQTRISQAKEEKERRIEEEKQAKIDLEMRIIAYIGGMADQPPELLDIAETNPGKKVCQYFEKMASCRYGHSCIWNHQRPKISNILLIESFFTNIHLEQHKSNEYGNDLTLEYDESDLYESFNEFFIDVVQEFEQFGSIRYFVVSMNCEPHIRGHVLIEYTSERNALKAQLKMNGRYYAGRMLNVTFCNILWDQAVCGLSLKNRCPKLRNCGYYHIFKNPGGQYSVEEMILQKPNNVNATISQRNESIRNEELDNWNAIDEQSKRNWRWSESPAREVVEQNVSQLKTEQYRCRGENRSTSPTHQNGRKRTKNRELNWSQSNKRSRRSSDNDHRNRKHKNRMEDRID